MKNFAFAFFVLILSEIFWSCSKPDQNPGDQYFKEGEYNKAAEEYTEKLKFDPNDVRMLYNRGRAHYQAGRYREAVVELDRALKLDPGSPNLVYNLARVHELLGDIIVGRKIGI